MEQISKKEQARQLYNTMMVDGAHPKRGDVIKRFMEEVQLTKAGAACYQNHFKTGSWSLTIATTKKEKKTEPVESNEVQQLATLFSGKANDEQLTGS